VISVQKINEEKFLIIVKPNSSLVGKDRIIFLLSISLICGGIATAFFFFGNIDSPICWIGVDVIVYSFLYKLSMEQ
jgi:hypothetical protein